MFFEDDHHQAWLVFDGCLRLTCPTYTVTPNHSYIQQCSGKLVYINVNTNLDPEFEIKWRKKSTPHHLYHQRSNLFLLFYCDETLLCCQGNITQWWKIWRRGLILQDYEPKSIGFIFFLSFFWENWNKTFSVYFQTARCIHQGIYLSCCCSDWSQGL